eukprot:361767-Chlamydomonas_euryale.AAC.14
MAPETTRQPASRRRTATERNSHLEKSLAAEPLDGSEYDGAGVDCGESAVSHCEKSVAPEPPDGAGALRGGACAAGLASAFSHCEKSVAPEPPDCAGADCLGSSLSQAEKSLAAEPLRALLRSGCAWRRGSGRRTAQLRGAAGVALRQRRARLARQRGTRHVLISQLHTLHVLLLLHQEAAVAHQHIQRHGRLGKLHLALARVDKALAHVLHAQVLDELTDLVVVHAGTQRAEEVDRLTGERVHQGLDLAAVDVVLRKNAHAHADAVLARRVPVVLLHAAITDKRCIKCGEIVARADDRHAGDGVLLVHARQLHVGRVVSNVHERGVDHLVVDSVLRLQAHAAGAGVEVVDEERAHLALLDHVRRLAVALADKLGGLAGVARLQLTSRHDDGGDAKFLVCERALEGLALALATPDAQDERHLDLGQVHEVLGNMDGHLVQEGRRDIEAICNVVERAASLCKRSKQQHIYEGSSKLIVFQNPPMGDFWATVRLLRCSFQVVCCT